MTRGGRGEEERVTIAIDIGGGHWVTIVIDAR
jgi:hypothetical protein